VEVSNGTADATTGTLRVLIVCYCVIHSVTLFVLFVDTVTCVVVPMVRGMPLRTLLPLIAVNLFLLLTVVMLLFCCMRYLFDYTLFTTCVVVASVDVVRVIVAIIPTFSAGAV
jgi:hypothetical protein